MKQLFDDDPRSSPKYQSELFPKCDGQYLPLEIQSDRERQKLALATTYYRLNVAYGNLRSYRRNFGKTADPMAVRGLLQKVESALLAKEAKEDELARLGVCATPRLRLGLVVGLDFCEPNRQARPIVAVPQKASLYVEFDIDYPGDENPIVP